MAVSLEEQILSFYAAQDDAAEGISDRAFTWVYRRWFQRIVWYVMKRYDYPQAVSEDIVQQGFLQLWEHRTQYSGVAIERLVRISFGYARHLAVSYRAWWHHGLLECQLVGDESEEQADD
jgi:hypothetical protein